MRNYVVYKTQEVDVKKIACIYNLFMKNGDNGKNFRHER